MNIFAEINHRMRMWTLPVVSSSIIHAGIVIGTLWLAIHWEPRAIFVEPLTLLERELEPTPAPKAPPPPEPPRKPMTRPVPPPPRETPKPPPEPEIARPAPPEPVKIPDAPTPVAEPPKPAPVVAQAPPAAPSPQVEPKPAEPTAAETKKESASTAEKGVVALGPPIAPSGPASAPPRAPEAAAPTPSPAAPGPLVVARAGEVSRPARPTGGYQVVPPYPAAARQQRIEGTTMLKVLVLADGRVGNVAVQKSAGHPDLDQAAADAVKQWHFDPARKGTEAVAMWVLLPVEFHLKD